MDDIKFASQRSYMGFSHKSVNVPEFVGDKAMLISTPVVIEGAELYDSICPVSKFTGKRCNPLSLLGLLTGAKAEVLNSILQELPTIKFDPKLSDQDRVDFIVERCSTGSPAEDALMAERLMNDLEALGLSSKQAEKFVDPSISFAPEDAPDTKGE